MRYLLSSGLMPDTIITDCLYQNYTTTAVQMCGGGWDCAVHDYPTAHTVGHLVHWNRNYYKTLPYQGNSHDAFFGTEIGRIWIRWRIHYGFEYETLKERVLNGPNVIHYSPTRVPGTPDAYYNTILGYTELFPTAFPAGQYDLRAFTYGYVQNKAYSAYGMPGQVADMKINLVIGVNVTLDILFKKEHIITPTAANMSGRVRLFDDGGNLVAEWMSSEGTYVTGSGFSRAADGTTQYPFGNTAVIPDRHTPLNTYNYIPGGTTILHVLMAGLPAGATWWNTRRTTR